MKEMKKKRARGMVVIALAICLVLCNAIPAQAGRKLVKAQSVQLNKTVYTLKKGKSVSLKATIKPKNAKTKKITWSTSNKKVATVSKKGKVTAKKNGKATITAKVQGTSKKATCKIVVGTPVTKVTLDQKSVSLEVGEQTTVKATVLPKNASTKGVTFASSNKEIASVSSSGKITALAEGTAKITATAKDGTGKKATVTVNVKKAADDSQTADDSDQTQSSDQSSGGNAGQDSSQSSGGNEGQDSSQPSGGDSGKDPSQPSGGNTQPETPKVTEVVASSEEEVKAALANQDLEKLIIQQDANIDLTIDEGEYKNVSLIVDTPNGHVENKALFKDISIKAISGSTYVEFAKGNVIRFLAQTGRIQIDKGATTAINVEPGAGELKIENRGSISKLEVATASNIDISGESRVNVPVEITNAAEGCKISTALNLDVKAEAKVKLNLAAGAENTFVRVPDDSAVPQVTGLGRIDVSITETGDVDSVVADHSENNETLLPKVSVKGSIKNTSGGALSGAEIYVILYSSEITKDTIEEKKEAAVSHVQSDEKGAYCTEQIEIGNYYLLVQKEGCADVMETLILTSASQKEHIVPEIVMLEASGADAKGTLTGTITDAQTQDMPADAGITVRLRAGRNNISGDPLMTTTIDANGRYTFENVPFGQYTVEIIDTRKDSDRHCIRTSFGAVVSNAGENVCDNSVSFIQGTEQAANLNISITGEDIVQYSVYGNVTSGQAYLYIEGYTESMPDFRVEAAAGATYEIKDADHTDYSKMLVVKTASGFTCKYYIRYALKESLFYIQDVVAKNEYGGPLLKNWSQTWDEEQKYGILVLQGYEETMPVNIEIVPENSETKVAIEASDKEQYEKKVVLTHRSVTRTYYISYELPDEIRFGINKVYDLQYHFYDFNISYTGEGENGLYILNIMVGNTTPNSPIIEPLYSGTTAIIKDSDNTEFDQMVTLSCNGSVRNYYIRYRVSPTAMFEIIGISAMEGEIDYIKGWSNIESLQYTQDENGEYAAYGYLDIQGSTAELPENVIITPGFKETTVKIQNSDREGYAKMATLTYGDSYCNYYIRYYSLLEDEVLGISDVSAIWENDSLITGWSAENYFVEENGKEIKVWYLDISGYSALLPNDLKITPKNQDASVEICDSDRYGYEKMAVVSCNELSRNYYLRYVTNYNNYEILSITDIVNEKNVIESVLVNWPSEPEDVPILVVRGWGTRLSGDCLFRMVNDNATAELKASDNPSYQQMVVVSYGGGTVNLYVDYQISEDAFTLSGITGADPLKWRSEYVYDQERWIVDVYLTDREMLDDLTFQTKGGAEARLESTDQSGDAPRFVVTYQTVSGEYARTYYVQPHIIETISVDNAKKVSLTGKEEIFRFTPEETGVYRFYTEGEMITAGSLCADSFDTALDSDDGDETDKNFMVTCSCEAGKTYYLFVYGEYGVSGDTTLYVEKAEVAQ